MYTDISGPHPYSLKENIDRCLALTDIHSSHYALMAIDLQLKACTKEMPCIEIGPDVQISYGGTNLSENGLYRWT